MRNFFVLFILLVAVAAGNGCAVWNAPLKPYYGSHGTLHNPYNPGWSPTKGVPYGTPIVRNPWCTSATITGGYHP